jgi:hypothetical protein
MEPEVGVVSTLLEILGVKYEAGTPGWWNPARFQPFLRF